MAALLAPHHGGVLRTLSQLLILDYEAVKALATIAKLETLERMKQPTPVLLKSRALLVAGRTDDAHTTFQEFLAQRKDIPQCQTA